MVGQYVVYILSSQTRVIYVGVTNDLERRLWEHRTGTYDSFTRRYRVNRLVHVETTHDVRAAIAREKQIKSWRREKKRALVEQDNPGWEDLTLRWQTR